MTRSGPLLSVAALAVTSLMSLALFNLAGDGRAFAAKGKDRSANAQIKKLKKKVSALEERLDRLETDEGAQGTAGPQGAQGSQGLAGPQGQTGPQGAQGPPGQSVQTALCSQLGTPQADGLLATLGTCEQGGPGVWSWLTMPFVPDPLAPVEESATPPLTARAMCPLDGSHVASAGGAEAASSQELAASKPILMDIGDYNNVPVGWEAKSTGTGGTVKAWALCTKLRAFPS